MKHVTVTLSWLLLIGSGLLAGCSERPVTKVSVEESRPSDWSEEAVEAFGSIPIQDRGRVKPLSTFCGFRMLAANGKRSHSIPLESGLPAYEDKLDPVRWAMDIMFFPEQAKHYETFMVNDSAVLEQVGLSFEGRKRRDRYSYAQLAPARERIDEKAKPARAKDAKERTRIESQLLALQQALFEYDVLRAIATTSTVSLGEAPSARLGELFPESAGGARIPLSSVLERWPTIVGWVREAPQGTPESEAVFAELDTLDAEVTRARYAADILPALIAPEDSSREAWDSPGSLAERSIGQNGQVTIAGSELEALQALGRMHVAAGDQEAVEAAILSGAQVLVDLAKARGEYANIPLERSYYRADYFYRALTLFLLGFVATVLSWTSKRLAKLNLVAWVAGIGAVVVLAAGITVRCLLLDRPPVATLYETILFITGVAVLVCLVMERLTKLRVGLTVGLAIGAAGMFIASRYELHEAATQGDTMGGLVAVLNTNFWLATHVVTVTMGYSAGLLAAVLGHVWLVRRLGAGIRAGGEALPAAVRSDLNALGRMIYGVICFGLLFSVVGTILGGVWANDSWGRFWGWDPKENGALMIVLYELTIVHARLGGYVKHFGIAVLAVLGGSVVTFSWWHVNLLGVGLHSYGFTDGIAGVLSAYYLFVFSFLAMTFAGWLAFVRPSRKLAAA